MENKIYYKLSDDEKDIIKKVQQRTITEYETKEDMVDIQSMMYMLEDLLCEIDRLEEELEEEIQDRKDNYKKISYEEMGWN